MKLLWLAYNKDETDVKFNTQKLLLVLKYFELNDAKSLQKVNQNYALQKDNYDNNQFNLIDYVLNKKLVQSWSYDNQSDKNDVFSTLTRSIQNVSDYNNLLKNTPALLNVASQELLFNANNSAAEVTMGGFANLKALPAEVKLSYDLQSLLQVTEAKKLSGFYNYQNNTLVPLSNTSLEAPVFVSRDGQLLKVSYFNQVAPIKDTIDGKDVLSFNKTAYASKLFNLEVNLAAYDDKLYNTAKSAFVALGYLLEVNNETLKEKISRGRFCCKIMEKSVFKKIIDRELPAEIIYEDDLVIAIMDAFPVSEGHFLVIPKSEKPNMLTHSEEEMTYAFKVAYKLAKERLWDKGIKDFRLMINTGLKGKQTVFHTHIHIVPYK